MIIGPNDELIKCWPKVSASDWYQESPKFQLQGSGTITSGRTTDVAKSEDTTLKEVNIEEQGIKDNKDKLFYELDFRFIQAMAKRMAENKGSKYPKWNWKKSIDVEELKQATFRHLIEVMEGNYDDEGKAFDHIVALSCNAMMLWHRVKAEQDESKLRQDLAQLK